MVKGKYEAILGGLIFVLAVAGGVLSSSVHADDVVDEINITVPVSCSFAETVSGNNTYAVSVMNNEYEDDIGHTTFKVFCNDKDGYSIYAVGYSEDTFGNTEMVYQGSANPTPSNIVTGTATSGSTSNWAMKMNAVTGTYAPTLTNGFGSYRTVPSTYTKVATFASSTDTTIGSSVQSSYAVFVSPTQPAGAYEGKVRYTLVHPNDASAPPETEPQVTEAGKICYYPNGSNVEGTMGCQTVSTSATSATLLASNFSRAGYGFAGWSKTFDYSDDTGFLGPQETITFTAGQYTGSNPGLSLYARWIKSAGSLQNWSGCSSLQSGAVTALTDQRDNETYAVAKLADGNCWMIENLRLESTNSDNSTGALAQGYGTSTTYGNFSGLADAESTNFSNSTTANSLYSTDGSNDTINIGSESDPGYRMPRYNNLNTPENASNRPQNPTSNSFTNNNTRVGMYSYGNYYTWHAAIADTTYYSSGDHGTTSLCPTGWRLPIGAQSTANMSFGKLSVELGGPAGGATADSSSTPTGTEMSKIFRSYPNNFLYSGYFNTSSADYRGSYGNYWSSTALNNYNSYRLYLNSTNVYPGTRNYSKNYGLSIRCVVLQSV